MNARCVMVLGTTSGAGKSWLVTALCRHYARRGLKVAPFKAQNMSNNARVVAGVSGGAGEIGSAQYFQALAAGAVPDVRMNPLLLKPEADTRSQVVLLGQVDHVLGALPWRERSEPVWPAIAASLDALRATHEVVVIEGAGSPAEINLQSSDIVNLRVARHANARCLLVSDIDRGGAFAHLYGTWALLPPTDQALLRGFVLNKFRGDPSLLAPAPQMLQQMTGIPTVATLPMLWAHGLPDEDGVFDERTLAGDPVHTTIAVIAYPRISNLDEFQPLKNVRGVRLVWARSPADCAAADWIILPGSKATAADLGWLRQQGLDRAIQSHARRGQPVLGICGGLQMLGQSLQDPHGVDGTACGLGLLPLHTVFAREKTVRRSTVELGDCTNAWQRLSRQRFDAYEIHHGQTLADNAAVTIAGTTAVTAASITGTTTGVESVRELVPGLAWQNGTGNVLGLYLHGLFESASVLSALFGTQARTLDAVFDGLADHVESHFIPGALDALLT